MNRVVITGMGAITPVGNSVQSYWESLINGTCGVDLISRFDVTDFTTKIAATVDNFDSLKYFDKKEDRRTSLFIKFAVAAAEEAIINSGIDIKPIAHSVGVEIGSGIGGIEILEKMAILLKERGPSKISPFTVPMMITDMASGSVAIRHGAKGPNSCSVSACASSAHSVINSFRLIQQNHATAMICGGAESAISPLGLGSFCAARSLSTNNENPKNASRPFDMNRDGFVMGEGAGILILEELEHALKRKANIYAEVVGCGSTGDAYHITAPAPQGEGGARALQLAMAEANLNLEDIDYINAHGTSTSLNDKNETAAIRDVFKDHADSLNVSSTKGMTGHLLGAAGAIELIACCQSINTGIIAPTINQEVKDPDCDLNYTPNKAIERTVNCTLSSSFGFGGHNAVIALKKY
ncbi:beta-ketoacyl-[acyl-carrier-protein] synthase II [Candidatus Marinamargulisbacteria bacterium SCGC AG-410-N11]|nr:beta-ketoacyl-[acyl-carrier-protein] synthase II [Candidatus Marinamargulisbacteria bacterium SCGC AG-410-N11]